MRVLFLRLLGCLMLFTVMPAAAGAQDRPPIEPGTAARDTQGATEPILQPHNPRYLLNFGDTLDITFRFTPEFNQTLTIQPDGFISLRDLPDLYVAGKTVPEVAEILQKKYARILHDPVLTLVLKEFEKPYFIANGELGHPGKYDLRGDTTVLEAIGIAGGLNERSKHSQVLLFRRVSDHWMSVKKLDIKAMLKNEDLSEDLRIRSGDMIYVPKNSLSKIKPWIPIPTIGVYRTQ